MALCTQQDVELFNSVDFSSEPDTAVTLWREAASRAIEGYCDRPMEQADNDITELFTGLGFHTIRVARYPNVTVTSITENGTVLTAADYHLDEDTGIIRRLTSGGRPKGWSHNGEIHNIEVVYNGGYDIDTPGEEPPENLRMACAQIVGEIFRQSQRWVQSRGADQVTITGIGSLNFRTGGANDQGYTVSIPADVKLLLSPFKRYGVGVGGAIA